MSARKLKDKPPVWARLAGDGGSRPGGTVEVLAGDDNQRFFKSLRGRPFHSDNPASRLNDPVIVAVTTL